MESELPHPDLYIADLFLGSGQDLSLILILGSVLILLLLCSALVSGAEVALFSLTADEVEQMKGEEQGPGQRIAALLNRPRFVLSTVMVSNALINITIVILSDYILRTIVPVGVFEQWGQMTLAALQWNGLSAFAVGTFYRFLIAITAVTALIALFGEVAPRMYGAFNNKTYARRISGVLSVLTKLFWPINALFMLGSKKLDYRFGTQGDGRQVVSEEEIDRAIEWTVHRGKNSEKEVDILKSIVKFSDVIVKQIMKSRLDVVAVDFNDRFEDIFELVSSSGFSRIPVYNEDFDNIIGILYVKDLLGYLDEPEEFEWQKLIHTDVLFVPESKKINELLKEFQQKRLHMAIVVDEYGGSSGIVTLEDVLEEVIGEIKDEFDEEEEWEYVKVDDRNYIFEGKTLLNDVCRIMGLDTTTFDDIKGDADSIAGLMLEVLGYLPKAEQEISYKQFRFSVLDVTSRRIERVKISIDANA